MIKTGKSMVCKQCKKEVYVPLWRTARFKYCSRNCFTQSKIGQQSQMLGKKHTREALLKMSSTWFVKGMNPWNKNYTGYKTKECTAERKDKTRKAIQKLHDSGAYVNANYPRNQKHHWWKGGATPFCCAIENSYEYKQWRKTVFLRDNRLCTACGSGDKINAHHIKALSVLYQDFLQTYSQFSPIEDKETLIRLAQSYKPFWDISNGLTLCEECHKKTDNFGAKYYWKEKNGIHK
jgi:5-methylcytosine-specific restriction endonuclease McrA